MNGLRIIPDAGLTELQRHFAEDAPGARAFKEMVLCEARRHMDCDWDKDWMRQASFAGWLLHRSRAFLCPAGELLRHRNCGILFRDIRAIFDRLDDTALSVPQQKQRLQQFHDGQIDTAPPLHVVEYALCGEFLSEFDRACQLSEKYQAAMIAVAVERYRRRHEALPESLNQLVPAFLDAVPVALLDGQPFDYEHGALIKNGCRIADGFCIEGRAFNPARSHNTSVIVPLGHVERNGNGNSMVRADS